MIKSFQSVFKAASKLFRPLSAAKAFASENGEQTPANQLDSAALERFKKAAESGDREAMFWLGRTFENGFGVDVDLLEAFKWYREAALKDHREAMVAGAAIQQKKEFIEAKFIEQDKDFFQKDLAAIKVLPPVLNCADSHIPLFIGYANRFYPVKSEPGIELIDSETFLEDLKNRHPKRMFQLSVLYQHRRLTPPSDQAIGRWICRAAHAGHIPAATSAGHLFLHGGYLLARDLQTVIFFYFMAARANEPVALREIWNLHRVAHRLMSFNDLFKCLVMAAEAGEPEAEVVLYLNLKMNPICRALYPGDPGKFLDSAAKKGYPRAVKLRKKARPL